ncbi:PTS ascorbate transporter subunit IIC [Mycoplasma sp. U97]|uniref:PTS ascorbate transporter subunit IIC n=1 Tax=Mycoplasma tauri TaxID=547987 RepID=UPI001CC04D56|nr:PTS ascorbate transporter subunit IIC [Mycoplasma tauri]MBZ4212683.1 PTS ascorbate transporter subunit IIC [Mycoplasma tauri]
MSETSTKRPFNWKVFIAAMVTLLIIIGIFFATLGYHWYKGGVNAETTKAGSLFFIKEIVLNNFLGVNAILIGLLVFLGYIILGRGFVTSFIGTLKAMIGVVLMQIGSGALIGLAKPVFAAFSKFSGVAVTPLDTYLGHTSSGAFLDSVGAGFSSWISYALIIGLFINIALIALRKYTNVRSLMITGHVMFQQAAVVVPVVLILLFSQGAGMRDASGAVSVGAQIGTILFSGILLGIYWGVASTSTIKGSDVVTQGAGFAVGHQQMFGVAIAYEIGRYFGKAEDSAENRKMPNKLKIFEDNIFTQSLLILFVFVVLIMIIQFAPGLAATVRFADLATGKVNSAYKSWTVGGGAVYWVINIILGSLQLVAAIIVIQTGVRMFVSELQQSFQGISEKLIPGAVVAVDVAATYGFSPNAVTFGFVSGTIAQFIGVAVVIGLSQIPGDSFKIPIVIPLFITLFFNSGSIGVFANASGGFKAAVIVPAIFGFLEIISIALGLAMFNSFGVKAAAVSGTPFATGYNGMFDWTMIWGLVMLIGGGHAYAAYVVLPLYIIGMLILAQIIDSARQTKPTFLQKAMGIKPKLIEEAQIA